jgi:hypothetical protein
MRALERIRRRTGADIGFVRRLLPAELAREEARLRSLLREDPNDVVAFDQLAEVVRRLAAEGHPPGDRQSAANDAVWALAEELARSGRAWYPLIELARLSIHDDREAALRRLATAADRDPSGQGLAGALATLRQAGMPGDALNLGVGHWRPREHNMDAARQLVEAAVESGRLIDARRFLDSLAEHPDRARADALRVEMQNVIDLSGRDSGVIELDIRDQRGPAARIRAFLHR